MEDNVLAALAFTMLAGLSTGVGSALAFFTKRTNTRFLAASLGFSAGVMIYVSFAELLAGAQHQLAASLGSPALGGWAAVGSFFGGMLVIGLIDRLVPEVENPHEPKKIEDMQPGHDYASAVAPVCEGTDDEALRQKRLMRMGVLTALVIGIHNFPEGLATFMTTLQDTRLGFSIAVAIAIHNIPEGIAVSVPIFYATGSKGKAFVWSFLSGLTEPLGAFLGYLVLRPFLNDTMAGIMLAAVAGIMVFISLDELLPSAQEYGEHHLSIYGAVLGMMVMAASLLLLI